MSFTKHPTAILGESCSIGLGCSIAAYSVLGDGVELGSGCVLDEFVVLAASVKAGCRTTFHSGCYVGESAVVGDDVRVGPRATLDSRRGQPVEIHNSAVIGAQASISPGVVIGRCAIVESGAVVTRNVPATAVVAGNPAKIIRYAAAVSAPGAPRLADESSSTVQTRVRGVTLHHLPMIEDLRGNLTFGEALNHVPFEVKRYFLTFDVATEEVRGEHAHRTLEQFLICVHGRLHIVADDGRSREEFVLDRPDLALYLPPRVWGVQYRFSAGAVLLVLCSSSYDPDDYIRDYAEFVALNTVE